MLIHILGLGGENEEAIPIYALTKLHKGLE